MSHRSICIAVGSGVHPVSESFRFHAVSAEAQLAECDVVKEEDRMLWCAQDAIVQALPHALSDAFQKVEADFFEHTKVATFAQCATVVSLLAVWTVSLWRLSSLVQRRWYDSHAPVKFPRDRIAVCLRQQTD